MRIIKTGALIDLNSETDEGSTTESLSEPCDRGNFSTAKISAAETVPIVGTGGDGDFELISRLHHHNLVVDIKVNTAALGSESEERFLGIFETTLSDQPPDVTLVRRLIIYRSEHTMGTREQK